MKIDKNKDDLVYYFTAKEMDEIFKQMDFENGIVVDFKKTKYGYKAEVNYDRNNR